MSKRRTVFTDLDKLNIIREYENKGVGLVAQELGLSETAITTYLKSVGLLRNKEQAKKLRRESSAYPENHHAQV